ncbi:Hypothetical predicted protein [Octopus vulgaris]|uniref:Uncharacterized protein n=1 Tax=Octopus vulgaris TaxID=6645 RepID=A0AA36BBZ7_OCTVU|nr:Hypothetical predicted protein [Octopus vulgaris]
MNTIRKISRSKWEKIHQKNEEKNVNKPVRRSHIFHSFISPESHSAAVMPFICRITETLILMTNRIFIAFFERKITRRAARLSHVQYFEFIFPIAWKLLNVVSHSPLGVKP